MHVQRLTIENIRSIERLELSLKKEERAGWHVILGDNGAGKSTVIRCLALALMGQQNAYATRQDWSRWVGTADTSGRISVELNEHPQDTETLNPQNRAGLLAYRRHGYSTIPAQVHIKTKTNENSQNESSMIEFLEHPMAKVSVWNVGSGWFSASFGPFRRFSGADPEMDKLYRTHPRLVSHLSAFGENVALGECLRWLRDLQVRKLEKNREAAEVQNAVISFINGASLLPHGARISNVTSERINVIDGRGTLLDVEELSDGYRSILSLTFELMRLIFSIFDTNTALAGIHAEEGIVDLPGVVAIDEIDAHLHPGWQISIGDWFVNHFPNIQFFVTTHSPIICRAAEHGSVWLLPTPGTDQQPGRIEGDDLNRLIYGNVLDAYDTELFGWDITRSQHSKDMLVKLALLNRKRLRETLSTEELDELRQLQATMASSPGKMAGD